MAKVNRGQPSFIPGSGPRTESDLPQAVRDQLVLSCMNLCRKLARSAAGTIPGADIEDLEGEAMLACVEAAKVWKPTLATDWESEWVADRFKSKFSTFAQSYIQKRLLGLATEQRAVAEMARPDTWQDTWEGIPGSEQEGFDPFDLDEPSEGDTELLVKIAEPARTAVRLVVFARLTPDQAAVQLGLTPKDLKLILRNAATELAKQKRRLAGPGLFAVSM